jgi:hypothetical protein
MATLSSGCRRMAELAGVGAGSMSMMLT